MKRSQLSRLSSSSAAAAVSLILTAAHFLAGCSTSSGTFELRGQTMGTTWSIRVVAPADGSSVALEPLRERVTAQIENLENVFSTWLPESEVSRFNAYPGQDWFPVSPVFLVVLKQAIEVSELSHGAFDPTVSPLVELWGFGASGEAGQMPRSEPGGLSGREAGQPPPQENVERLLGSTGFSHLQLRDTPPAVRRTRRGVQLDFSAIAKGYAVDEVWGLLSEAGLSDYLVEIGGEVRTRGMRADGRAWSIGIESPDRTGVTEAVPLRDAAIATSGDYRNFFEHEDERYSHVLDPRTGWPVSHGLSSVTVIASSAATADALATALLVLGPDTGLRLAVDHGMAARLVSRTANGLTVLRTPAFEATLSDDRL